MLYISVTRSRSIFSIESKVSDIVEIFVDIYNIIPGRIKADSVKKLVAQLIDLWEKWGVFSKLLCQNLRFMFTKAYQEEISNGLELEHESESGADGSAVIFESYWSPDLLNPEVDGAPIAIVDQV